MNVVKLPKQYVEDIYTKTTGLTETAPIIDAVESFIKTKFAIVPIVKEDNSLVGVFTKSNLFSVIKDGKNLQESVGKYMERKVKVVRSDELTKDVFHRLPTTTVGQYVVVDEHNKVKGIMAHINVVLSLLENTGIMANHLDAVIEGIHNGVMATDESANITLMNYAASKLFNMKGEDMIGRHISEAFPGTQIANSMQEVVQSGESKPIKKDVINSAKVITSYSPVLQDNHVLGALGIFQDVTDLDHLSNELDSYKKIYNTLETVLDVGSDGIVVINRDGIIEWCNEAFSEFVGTSKDKVLGKDIDKLIKDTTIKTVLKTGSSFKGQLSSFEGKFSIMFCNPINVDGVVEGAVGRIIFRGLNELKDLLKRIEILEKQVNSYQELPNKTGALFTLEDIVTVNDKMIELKQETYNAARSNCTVLIRGESGTGKELFAHTIHNCSYRFLGPFIKVNCAAVPEHLLESEFFGYEDGAFTGAKKGGNPGKFEMANGGTLFLDEIGDMSLNLQAKLLRVLEDNEVTRVGGIKVTKVDVRVVASTNRDLEKMIEMGQFRQDLYYRLNVISLCSSPLRERMDDIPILIISIIQKYNLRDKKQVVGVEPKALALLMDYDWPGNVRELENVIERAVSLSTGGLICEADLPNVIKKIIVTLDTIEVSKKNTSYKNKIHETEKEVIIQALKAAGGNKTEAAKNLGISRTALYQKLKQLNIGNSLV